MHASKRPSCSTHYIGSQYVFMYTYTHMHASKRPSCSIHYIGSEYVFMYTYTHMHASKRPSCSINYIGSEYVFMYTYTHMHACMQEHVWKLSCTQGVRENVCECLMWWYACARGKQVIVASSQEFAGQVCNSRYHQDDQGGDRRRHEPVRGKS